MFNTVNTNQVVQWPTPGVGPFGGKWGDALAAPISQALAPYIANRNDGIAARRVEAIRLPQASKQSDVRLRLTHISHCGWEWGVDNIAFYDIAGGGVQPPPPGQPKFDPVSLVSGKLVLSWTGTGTLQQADTVNGAWTPAPSQANPQNYPVAGGAKFFRISQQ
jgi:hypothetical protein